MSVKKSEKILQSLEKTIVSDKSLTSEMEGSFLDYSMSVIKSRALPDYRDGLKPVHRRIIYSAFKEKLTHDNKYKKSAAIVGSVMGSYHPHGDAAIYESLVRMAQDFSLRYPLIQGQGNFGSIDGDSPAAMRYTEARLSGISDEFLKGLDEDWVEMVDNYDQSKKEPVVLPTLIPNLLINGGEGIAVGLATKIPSHNLSEVIDAVLHLLDNPNMKVDDLFSYIKGPDFPTGGEILRFKGVEDYFRSSDKNTSFILRARADIESFPNKRSQIIIKEIPYGVKKEAIIKRIVALATEDKKGIYVKELGENITDIRDESDRNEMRLIIEVKVGYPPEIVLNNLYKYTRLQVSYAANLTVLVDNEPKKLSVLEILKHYLDYQFELLRNRTKFRILKLSERIHILQGRLKIVDDVMNAITLITSSDDPDSELQAAYELTKKQLEDILALPIGRLKRLKVDEMRKELREKENEKEDKEEILSSEDRQKSEIRKQLIGIKERYGDDRKTIINREEDGRIEFADTRHFVQTVFMLSKKSYLSQIPLSEFRMRKRENRGVDSGAELYRGDAPRFMIACYGKDDLLFFTEKGRVYRRKAYDLNLGSGKVNKGRLINNLLNIGSEIKDVYMISLTDDDYKKEDLFLVFATEQGMVKKTHISKFKVINSSGKIAIGLKEGDRLKFVVKTSNDSELCLSNSLGKLVRCPVSSFRSLSRASMGRQGIDLTKDSHLTFASTSYEGNIVISISKYGKLNCTDLKEYRLTKKGNTKGVISQKSAKQLDSRVFESEIKQIGKEISKEFIDVIGKEISKESLRAYKEKINKKVRDSLKEGYSEEEFKNKRKEFLGRIFVEFERLSRLIERTVDDHGDTLACILVNEEDEILLMSDKNKISRFNVSDLRISGRNSMGVKSFRLDYDDKVEEFRIAVKNKNIDDNVVIKARLIRKKYKEQIVYWIKQSKIKG